MTKTQRIILLLSIGLSLLIIFGALIVVQSRRKPAFSENVEQHPVSKTELSKATGKNGKDCYIAVDGTVYLVKDFSLWQEGKHVSSEGMAYCGADLSKVIDKSPHGRKILDLLITIGPLKG